MWGAGVDGCRAGWMVVSAAWTSRQQATFLEVHLCAAFTEVLALHPAPTALGVDMPIGLLDTPQPGGRPCDRQARRLLGRRASSIFSPPSRLVLDATHYAQVRGHGMSLQAFGILPKIRELDGCITPTLQERVCEAHPELAFRSLTGYPITPNKKTAAGYAARFAALTDAPQAPFYRTTESLVRACNTFKRSQVTPDDVLDAAVLAWTACRIAMGVAQRVPAVPQYDRRGLRMEIWY